MADYSQFRPSTNVEDDRQRSFPSKMAEDVVNTYKDVGRDLAWGVQHPLTPYSQRDKTNLPDTTSDPLASQAGYNDIKNFAFR